MKGKVYKVVIVDDETYCVDNIIKSLKKYPEMHIFAIAKNANEGIEAIMVHQPDLLFLDVEMPEQTGFEMLNQLEYRITWNMQVVFHTAFNNYLLDALRNSAFDFLLKPYVEAEFDEIIKRFLKQKASVTQPELFMSSLLGKINNNHTLLASTSKGYQVLKVEKVVCFQYDKSARRWKAFLNDTTHLTLKNGTTADDIEKYSPSFVRINQNCMINFEYLSYIEFDKCIMIEPYDKIELKISRTYISSLQKKFELI